MRTSVPPPRRLRRLTSDPAAAGGAGRRSQHWRQQLRRQGRDDTEQLMCEEAAFAYQMQLAMAMSAREAELAGSTTGPDFAAAAAAAAAAAPSAARNTPTHPTTAAADSAAAEVLRSRRDGQTVANRYYITMCMDYAHAPYNGFYDLWGDFPEAETGNSRLPPLERLAQIGYDGASPGRGREVLLVDHCSDGDLQKLRAQALAALATMPVSQYRAKVCVRADHHTC